MKYRKITLIETQDILNFFLSQIQSCWDHFPSQFELWTKLMNMRDKFIESVIEECSY